MSTVAPASRGTSKKPIVFDCSDLVLPASQALVDKAIEASIQQWKDLEKRKVHGVDEVVEKDSTNKRKRSGEQIRWGWHANRLRLPEYFDYATRESAPPEDDGSGDRVVSLEDTSVHLSFEQELWKIFRAVPTVEQIEAEALEGAECRHMRALNVEMTDGIQQHSRMDCHALSRLRMNDRHGLPHMKNDTGVLATTIRMECWRRHMKRGSSPDGNRMELEFLGSQTLQDVHDVIVELSKDELWNDSEETRGNEEAAGMFFVEDTFFTSGSVDYTSSILTWLDGTNPGPPRRSFLGLPLKGSLKIQQMSSVRLDQLHWRLGVRYFHSLHGDVECSVFLTDIRQCRISSKMSFPIIYDVWTPPYSMVECEACRHRVGVLCASSSNNMTDGGPRALCKSCHQQLHPLSGTELSASVLKYSVWRDQVELSVGHQDPDTLF